MKSIKRIFLFLIFSLLLTSCSKMINIPFEIYGTVTTDTGIPIPDIKVYLVYGSDDVVYTDLGGKYKISGVLATMYDVETIYFEDVDGEANGGYYESEAVGLDGYTEIRGKSKIKVDVVMKKQNQWWK